MLHKDILNSFYPPKIFHHFVDNIRNTPCSFIYVYDVQFPFRSSNSTYNYLCYGNRVDQNKLRDAFPLFEVRCALYFYLYRII